MPRLFFLLMVCNIESDEGKEMLKEYNDYWIRKLGIISQLMANLSAIKSQEQREEIVKTNEV